MLLHNKNYVLISELAHKSYKHISFYLNMLQKVKGDADYDENVVKYGQCLFIHKDYKIWTPKIRKLIQKLDLKDWSQYLPINYLINTYKINVRYCEKRHGKVETYDFITKKDVAYPKTFFKFNDEIYEKLKNKTWIVVKDDEIEDFCDGEKIDSIQISKNMHLFFY